MRRVDEFGAALGALWQCCFLVGALFLAVGCTPDVQVRPRADMTHDDRDAARERFVGQWLGVSDADGRMHEIELRVDDQTLAMRVDDQWEPPRAWTPTASEGDALVVVVIHDSGIHEAVVRFEDVDTLRVDFVSKLRLHRVPTDRD